MTFVKLCLKSFRWQESLASATFFQVDVETEFGVVSPTLIVL